MMFVAKKKIMQRLVYLFSRSVYFYTEKNTPHDFVYTQHNRIHHFSRSTFLIIYLRISMTNMLFTLNDVIKLNVGLRIVLHKAFYRLIWVELLGYKHRLGKALV